MFVCLGSNSAIFCPTRKWVSTAPKFPEIVQKKNFCSNEHLKKSLALCCWFYAYLSGWNGFFGQCKWDIDIFLFFGCEIWKTRNHFLDQVGWFCRVVSPRKKTDWFWHLKSLVRSFIKAEKLALLRGNCSF